MELGGDGLRAKNELREDGVYFPPTKKIERHMEGWGQAFLLLNQVFFHPKAKVRKASTGNTVKRLQQEVPTKTPQKQIKPRSLRGEI